MKASEIMRIHFQVGCLALLLFGAQGFAAQMAPGSSEKSANASRGLVRLSGRVLYDASGPFLGLGATYMQALRHFKVDRARFQREIATLARSGFNYVRILTMVDWLNQEIAPVAYRNREGNAISAWPDYDQQLEAMILALGEQGLRAELTVFADAQRIMPNPEDRQAHVDRVLGIVKKHESAVCMIEVANEAWQNGFADTAGIESLRSLGERIAKATDVLVALSAPPDLSEDHTELLSLYKGSAADIATVHFSRDTRSPEGSWKPVIAPWGYAAIPGVPPVSSNEPIGPGSSVASETDPAKLLALTAFAYVAGLPMLVFHSEAGVAARMSFSDLPWLGRFADLMKILPRDLSDWKTNDGLEPSAPFTVFLDGTPNAYWKTPEQHKTGLLRACGATSGPEFIVLPVGILEEGAVLEVRAAMAFTEYSLPDCQGSPVRNLAKGERFELNAALGTCLLRGRYSQETPK